MAQFETTGGSKVSTPEKITTRKVVISTGGSDPSLAAATQDGVLTSKTITQEGGGLRRGVFEYTIAGGESQYAPYRKKIQLQGGSREVSILSHPYFANMSKESIFAVQSAVEQSNSSYEPETPEEERLFDYLSRGITYILMPSVTASVTELESNLPTTYGLCKVANPSVTPPKDTFWVWTGISASQIGDKFEVTREYTSVASTWADVDFLYNYWD